MNDDRKNRENEIFRDELKKAEDQQGRKGFSQGSLHRWEGRPTAN